MSSFFCKLVPPRPTFAADLSPAEAAANLAYWRRSFGQDGTAG